MALGYGRATLRKVHGRIYIPEQEGRGVRYGPDAGPKVHMHDTKYLFQRNQIWWVKVAVPRTLRDKLGYDLRRSLHTADLDEARRARDLVVREFRHQIAEARKAREPTRACRTPVPADDEDGYPILRREDFSDVTFLLEVEAPMLARAARPGQFVIVILHERGERIPLTIADFDRDRGTITLVIQAVGKSTREMQVRCRKGTHLHALVGPMGYASEPGANKVVLVGASATGTWSSGRTGSSSTVTS